MTIVSSSPRMSSRIAMSAIDYAVQSLRRSLDEIGYNPAISREICISAHNTHDLVEAIGLGMIDDDDIDSLTEALADGFPEVPLSSGAWDVVNDRWEAPIPSAEESAEYARMIGTFDADHAPIGEPLADAATFEPSQADWDDFHRWAVTADAATASLRCEEAELAEIGCRR